MTSTAPADEFSHFLTTGQVAATFGVDVSTVTRWSQMGHLESSRFGIGRTAPRVYNADTVAAFADALTQLAAAKTGAA